MTYSYAAIFFRALLYMLVAAMPELISGLSAAAQIYWPLTIAKMVFAALVALRAFIDKSSSNVTQGSDSKPTIYLDFNKQGTEAEDETG